MAIITFTTDFGQRDWFVGTMKGAALAVNPRATLVDISHEIPPGDIRAGAFALAVSGHFFPKGTVQVAVVDPGVGSDRKAIVVRTRRFFFVGPDNGVLSWALSQERILSLHRLENEAFFSRPVSRTFHGRDIFAPVAAHLSRGLSPAKLGPAAEDFVRLEWPVPRRRSGQVDGEVLYVDRFGNAITNIDAAVLEAACGGHGTVMSGGKRLCPIADCYAAVAHGSAVAVQGSSGFLEIAVNGGHAGERLGLRVGTRITVRAKGAFP